MGNLTFRLLGPVEVLRDGQQVPVRGTALALLAGLLVHANQQVSATALADLAWGSQAPAHPRAALHSAIARLRRTLGGDTVQTLGGGYKIIAGPGELDLLRFSDLAEAAGKLLAADRDDPRALALLEEALGLWRHPVLEDVASEALQRDMVPRLTEQYVDARETWAELSLRLGRHHGLAGELAGLARQFPFRERLTASLMTALRRSGRPADALAAYERLRTALREELGIDPAAELQGLHLGILRADPDSPQ